ncbi:MAG: DUF2914 domain-containing protein [Proteobacteria bacterium]|nr:DUF2914 domain-containing protein [Pseudomonadota bacterium]MBU1389943.1 DUF2914 domain-containing protein [Pseudomonadota bacterium]MBU1542542.1 DUF2914 domain-containing protein [Pseudomonadota bacterium]MBU2479711.1 DUF2914 domain-containing protein [Pseudomonadota bacterium]
MKNLNSENRVPGRHAVMVLFCMGVLCLAAVSSPADELNQKKMPVIVLEKAVMCGAIDNFKPVNPAVIFSISQGEVFCYSNFDPVRDKTSIFHKWYKKDKLIFTMQLTLSPPKWASFSSIKIRNADKGPWRVEIRDMDDTLLQTLRFSMAD